VEQFTGAVRACLAAENWYGALMIALILPDICGKLEHPTLRSQERYTRWYDAYVLNGPEFTGDPDSARYRYPTAEDCYVLRCAIVHEGSEEVSDTKTKAVLGRYHFFAPERDFKFFGHQSRNVGQLPVDKFCEKVCLGVDHWTGIVLKATPELLRRSENLIRIRRHRDEGFQL
jgi:hypothetical protein